MSIEDFNKAKINNIFKDDVAIPVKAIPEPKPQAIESNLDIKQMIELIDIAHDSILNILSFNFENLSEEELNLITKKIKTSIKSVIKNELSS